MGFGVKGKNGVGARLSHEFEKKGKNWWEKPSVCQRGGKQGNAATRSLKTGKKLANGTPVRKVHS